MGVLLLLLEATSARPGPAADGRGDHVPRLHLPRAHAPGILAWKGASFDSVAYHQWLSTEGVFGIALGVSTDLVFLFVLFGALLDKAGAGNYFIKVAFSLMGHLRGGPAKAAVVASGMTGLISGSSIANVVTTGTFTIPMMKRVGFSREKGRCGRGGLLRERPDHAAGHGGGRLPDGRICRHIPYFEVVKHAFIAGGDLLHRAGLYRASGSHEEGDGGPAACR